MVARCHMFVVCFFGFIFQSGSEPVCTSRFDYDVRLLESYLELKQSYRQLTETVDQLTSSLKSLQDRSSQGTENNPAGMKVAFYVQLTNDLTNLGNYQTLIFDQVTTNIGNGYNPIDGVFTAPVGGTYVFCWTNTNKDKSYMNTELIKNKELFGKAMSDAMDHFDYAVASNTAVLQVETGDKVWIRSGTWHSNKVAGQLYTTFSGWKL